MLNIFYTFEKYFFKQKKITPLKPNNLKKCMCNKHISSSYLTPLFTSIMKLKSSQLNWIYKQYVTHTGN